MIVRTPSAPFRSSGSLRLWAAVLLMAVSAASAHAQSTLFWSGDGTAPGGNGTWNTSALNWSTSSTGPFTGNWTNGNYTARFAGAVATPTVTLGENITAGSLWFDRTGYTIVTGANTLTLGAATNAFAFNNVALATINGTIGGTGNLTIASTQRTTAGTLAFTGNTTGGWSGITTLGPNLTVTLDAAASLNRNLLNTSAIALYGGSVSSGVIANNANANANRINDAANWTVNGGAFTWGSSNAGGTYRETIGTVTLNRGQMNVSLNGNLSSGSQELTVGTSGIGLVHSGFSAVTFSNAATNFTNATGNNRIRVNGITTSTPANEIIGPWATIGSAAGAQSDYARYDSDGTYGYVLTRNIAASAQSTWSTTHAGTSNYTLVNTGVTAATNGRLTAGRYINTLRNNTLSSAAPITDVGDYFTVAGNDLQNGDVVTVRNATGLTNGQAYYVVNKDVNGVNTFQVATTPGGSAVAISGTTANVNAGLSLNGQTLGTFGILNGSSEPFAIGRSGGGAVTLPTTASGNLYVINGNASVWVDAPITDNGPGVLTLIKGGTSGNGSGTVTLSGTNTYTGGTVINSGALGYTTDAALGASGSRNVTFNGIGSLTWGFDGSSLGTLTVNQGAVATLSSLNTITFATTTGGGTVVASGGQNKIVSLGNASTFTGDVVLAYNANNNSGTNNPHLRFTSLNDAAGSALQIYRVGGGTDSGQIGQVGIYGDAGPVTFNQRQVQILSRPTTTSNPNLAQVYLSNNNSNAANTWVINTPLLNASGRDMTLGLMGTNIGDNEFSGVIGNSIYSASNPPPNGFSSGTGVLSLSKQEAGRWILSNTDNSYTGSTVISGGWLTVTKLANGNATSSIGASSNAASNLSMANGTRLRYIGSGDSTDRSFLMNLSTAGHSVTIEASGTGAVNFTNTSTPGYGTANQTRTLGLSGSNTGANTLAATLVDNGTGALSINKLSPGRWVLTGINTYTGTTTINDGVIQAAVSGGGLPTSSILQLRGGVFQSSGTFTRTVGTAAGNVNWSTSSGGFSAIGGALNVQLNGGTGSVTWNGASMVSTGQTLIFGSASADSMVDWQNSLNLGSSGSGQRTIQVVDNSNSTTDIARISGSITNTAAGWGIIKTGNGTLELTGTNTYTGGTTVSEGILLINGDNSAATGAISVAAGAYLGGTGTIGADLNFAATSLFEIADINDPLAVTGTVTFGSGFGIANLAGIDWNALDLNTAYTLISTSQTFTSGDISNFGAANAAPVGGGRSAYFQSGSLQLVVVPEPAALALAGLGIAGIASVIRRRRKASN